MALTMSRARPNNSFKPNLLRSTNNMAERACHVVGSTTQVGLTQALGLNIEIIMSGTNPPTIDADIKQFIDKIGARVPLAGTEHYDAFRSVFKKQNYFSYDGQLLVIKISRSSKPFWGLTKEIIDFINDYFDHYFVVFLTLNSKGWVFSKTEVISHTSSEEWALALDGNYKINSPLSDNNLFTSIESFKSKLGLRN